MKLIIAGSRNKAVPASLLNRLIEICGFTPTELVSGACRGIDTCGEIWARDNQIRITRFPFKKGVGKAGGPLRNQEMADYADALLALPGSGSGTWDMIRRMRKAGKPVRVWETARERWIETPSPERVAVVAGPGAHGE